MQRAQDAQKKTELHAGPMFVHIKSSDVCNFAGILISLLLFFGVFCGASNKKSKSGI